MTDKTPLEILVQCKKCTKVKTETGWVPYQSIVTFGYYYAHQQVKQSYCPPCSDTKQKEVFDVDDFMKRYFGR